MIEKLREAFADLVTHNDWMDESTKSTAIEKVRRRRRCPSSLMLN